MKNFLYVLFANLVNLVINIVLNFALPKFLSVETYGIIKTYTLYASYAGFFALGYNDGMYLRFGGFSLKEIEKNELADDITNYLIMEIAIFSLGLLFAVIIKDKLIWAFSVGILFINLNTYFRQILQATGEFKNYGRSLNIEKMILLLFSGLFLLADSDNPYIYIFAQIIGPMLSLSLLLFVFKNTYNLKLKGRFNINIYKKNISLGFILMLGNFSNIIFTGVDRWFVKFLMSLKHFAMYSFAASTEGVLNVFLTPFVVTLYNYFCKSTEANEIIKIKRYVLIWGFLIIGFAYPLKYILENYLQSYREVSMVIFFLFGSQLFHIIIKGIYINLYKANKRQIKYLKQMIVMIFVAIILNILMYMMHKSYNSFAVATFVTAAVWFLLCEIHEKKYAFRILEYISILVVILVYFILGYTANAISGFIVYYLTVLAIGILLCKEEFLIFFQRAVNTIRKIFERII